MARQVVLGMPSDGGTNCGSFHLRSGDRRLEILSPGGRFHSNSRGEAVVLVRGTSPGSISVWVEPWGGSSVDGNKQSAVQLHFADPPGSISIPRGLGLKGGLQSVRIASKAFLHAWSGYKRNAWGSDELKPISLEGLAFVERDLDFDTADREISVFEVVVRALGGLLGAHSLSGRPAPPFPLSSTRTDFRKCKCDAAGTACETVCAVSPRNRLRVWDTPGWGLSKLWEDGLAG
eukprot:s2153_g1.t1